MAEAQPNVNHHSNVALADHINVESLTLNHCGNSGSQQNHSQSECCEGNSDISFVRPTQKIKSVEMDKVSDVLFPDVRHINGFYTIADTLHKENSNSAVTLTTQSQMGEVRMSSRVADPPNYKHSQAHIHNDWTKQVPVSPINNDHVQHQLSMASENIAFNPLKDLTDCVEQITLLEDEDFNSKADAPENLEFNNISHLGNDTNLGLTLTSETENLLIPNDKEKQLGEQSVRKKDRVVKLKADRTICDNDNCNDEIPSNISEFVLGHGCQSHLAVHVPHDDSDLDRILPNGFEVPIELVPYESELQMPDIMRLITKDLSEPYSIYTYRYFIHNWPSLCFLAMHGSLCVGAIVCKLDVHKKVVRRGYIAMLAVDENYRKHKIGSSLVRKAIRAMIRGECDEVVLETEITNKPALRLYENLGFSRDKRLFRYYLNGVDALRLKLWLR